ncbi:MAG: hypothetical protein ACK5KO_07135 [Arachnia sp.]
MSLDQRHRAHLMVAGLSAGMMGRMDAAEPLSGLVVCLPEASLEDLIGPMEVLVQEELGVFAVPGDLLEFDAAVGIFGARARFGVHGVWAAEQIGDLAARGASFVLADSDDPALAEAGAECGIPVYLQAMTPREVRMARAHGNVQLYPADVVGHVMAERLAGLGLIDGVVPRGGLGAFAAEQWFKAGAQAACVDATLLGDSLRGGDLGALRDRCASFRRATRSLQPEV